MNCFKVLYANQWDENPEDITRFAPGCGDSIKFCNVVEFIEQSRLLFFDNVQEECLKGSNNLSSRASFQNSNLFIILIVFLYL